MTDYDFPPYQLRPDQGLLLANGQPVPLRAKSWSVLCYLIEHRDRAVSKDELLNEVWGGLVVHEQAVFQSISEIRASLRPLTCIQTIRGRGYRWVAAPQRTAVPKRRFWPLPAFALALVLLSLAGSRWDSQFVVPVRGLQLQAESSATLPLDLLAKALPKVPLGTGPGEIDDELQLSYQLELDEDQSRLSYRLRAGDQLQAGQLQGSTAALVHDLAAALGPLLLADYPETTLSSIYQLYPAAMTALDNNQLEEAEATLRTLLRIVPDYEPGLLRLAELALRAGRAAEATRLAQRVAGSHRVIAQGRLRSQALLLLGEIALQQARWAEAASWSQMARQAALADGDDYLYALAQEQLADTALALGDRQNARTQLLLARSLYLGFCPTGVARIDGQLRLLTEQGEGLAL